jgi:hypothetical protein
MQLLQTHRRDSAACSSSEGSKSVKVKTKNLEKPYIKLAENIIKY